MSLISIEKKIAMLEQQMADAAAGEDFERAARLRDELATLRGELRPQQPAPGQMGLGTHLPVAAPPSGWRRPKRPDPMTKNVRKRKG